MGGRVMHKISKSKKITSTNLATYLTEYEKGNLGVRQSLKLYSFLIKTGLAWKLQGKYGRLANQLVSDGVIDDSGKINWKKIRVYD